MKRSVLPLTLAPLVLSLLWVTSVLSQDAPGPSRAQQLNQAGERHHAAKRYAEAAAAFRAALDLVPKNSSSGFRFDLEFNLANSRQMGGDLRGARALYERLIRSDPARAPRYHDRLDILEFREREAWTKRLEVKGDRRLAGLVRRILPLYQGLRLPLEVRLVTDDENNRAYLEKLGVPTRWVPISESSTVRGRHLLLYNASFWAEATDQELLGNLAHELMHREWEDLRLQRRVFDWTRDTLAYASLEHVIDYCVLGKGLGAELYAAKAYLLRHGNQRYLQWDIAPNAHHVADVLTRASAFEMPGRGDAIPTKAVPPPIAAEVKERLRAFSWHRR